MKEHNGQEDRYMEAALQISKQALPDCLPNPPVGCVVVSEGKIIAKGFTQPPGEPHAEVHALSQIPERLNELTVYITLEPCSFYGKTPSCATTIATDTRIGKVVVAMIDPDPRNNGKGIAILKSKGKKVVLNVASEKVSKFLRPYLVKN
ncbi:bifunctional diaminohydroxyphosphoribosylaminopyrimidine deaminase/5-amino-6-(5-phosphoribosylamino)uracil reductase RibD [Tunicatimonas pelagia]|uniref:bifunctional diaminohydroxyphosphoribosylaminopyrimidine deaminase/5-amino-6-(5-phosphoribosylamino)uracil reductase RibD n=1 Tax=Tunicatimonas pelagia TaxID=931531 RepID=UPI00266703F9|nr:bifunctional diaminohydroxyphosphoribosylaminopyrimidine deaminase/5-amino-6-(5-phosphoribosylamino)uracil reductase RibD [Tunicatimonas pelagia]WKN40631.1 bifunctional diaminohydroxyphosphoribosylaminopyrimidine deaminase/5-amino-6-(5-phosphoribosylamino)uracil reductase RibD [Tunicatimonas pelagia]